MRSLQLIGIVFGAVIAVGGCTEVQSPTGAPPVSISEAPPPTEAASTAVGSTAATTESAPTPAATAPAATAPATTATPAIPTTVAPSPATAPAVRPVPTGVRIPSIGVESVLLQMGIRTEDGAAEVPEDYDVAGWYANGSRPGGRGPTVLVGHVDSRSGPAVFYRLQELAPGDQIEVQLADGTVARYAVEITEQFPKLQLPIFEVFGATERDILRLVTCTGEFDYDVRSYFDNLIVTAVRI